MSQLVQKIIIISIIVGAAVVFIWLTIRTEVDIIEWLRNKALAVYFRCFPAKRHQPPTETYIPFSAKLKDILTRDLEMLKSNYPNLDIRIFIDTESGSSNRDKVEADLFNILEVAGFQVSGTGKSVIMRGPGGPPAKILLNHANIKFAEQLSEALKQFLDTEFPLETNGGFPKDALKIFIKGDPLFSSNGVVTFR